MERDWLGLVELILVVGLVFGLGVQQLVALRRERRRRPPRDAG